MSATGAGALGPLVLPGHHQLPKRGFDLSKLDIPDLSADTAQDRSERHPMCRQCWMGAGHPRRRERLCLTTLDNTLNLK